MMLKQSILDLANLAKLSLAPHKNDPGYLYDNVHFQQLLASERLFINLGYWHLQDDYDQACKALALKLSEWANLAAGDSVLAAGCGFGEECQLWQQHYQLSQMVGINLSAKQLAVADKQFTASSVRFMRANATRLSFANHAFDKILALESAMHFQPKQRFFQEAYRALKPGGTLALADMICIDQPLTFYWKVLLKYLCKLGHFPTENMCLWGVYENQLKQAGFQYIEMQDISSRVLKGLMWHLQKINREGKLYLSPAVKILAVLSSRKGFPFRYILVRAQKPDQSN